MIYYVEIKETATGEVKVRVYCPDEKCQRYIIQGAGLTLPLAYHIHCKTSFDALEEFNNLKLRIQ